MKGARYVYKCARARVCACTHSAHLSIFVASHIGSWHKVFLTQLVTSVPTPSRPAARGPAPARPARRARRERVLSRTLSVHLIRITSLIVPRPTIAESSSTLWLCVESEYAAAADQRGHKGLADLCAAEAWL